MLRDRIHSKKTILVAFFACILIASALILRGWGLVIACFLTLSTLLLFDKGIIRNLGGRKFWLGILISALFFSFLGGKKTLEILPGFGFSGETFYIFLRIAFRGFLVFSAMLLIRRHIHPAEITRIISGIGLKGATLAIPISFHLLPMLMESSRDTYMIWKMRGGWKRNRFQNPLLLLTSLQMQWIAEAEELSITLALDNMNHNPSKNR